MSSTAPPVFIPYQAPNICTSFNGILWLLQQSLPFQLFSLHWEIRLSPYIRDVPFSQACFLSTGPQIYKRYHSISCALDTCSCCDYVILTIELLYNFGYLYVQYQPPILLLYMANDDIDLIIHNMLSDTHIINHECLVNSWIAYNCLSATQTSPIHVWNAKSILGPTLKSSQISLISSSPIRLAILHLPYEYVLR